MARPSIRPPTEVVSVKGSSTNEGRRTILHVDMDAFYVSVELLRRPELRGRPVVVGGDGSRGVVAAANYEARRYGVFSAMPSSRARRLCPEAVFLPGDHRLYAEISERVHGILREFTPLIEPIALDEAFLDVGGSVRLFGDGVEIGRTIRRRIHDELGLPSSVGVAGNKFLAKLASKAAKPVVTPAGIEEGAGVLEVPPGGELSFLHPLPVRALWGVGPATLAKLDRFAIETVGDLAAMPREVLMAALGRSHGSHLHDLAHAVDDREVESDRETKSIGHEETFARDLADHDSIHAELVRLADAVAGRLRAHDMAARTVTLKLKFADFRGITRSATPGVPLVTSPAMLAAIDPALRRIDVSSGVRLVGISVSNFVEAVEQPSLLDGALASDAASTEAQWTSASRAIDEVRARFGRDAIAPARVVGGGRREVGSSPWGPGSGRAAEADPGPRQDSTPPESPPF